MYITWDFTVIQTPRTMQHVIHEKNKHRVWMLFAILESPKSHHHVLGSLPVLTQMERMMGLSQPNFDDSGDSDALLQPQDEKSDVMSLISESDACSISDFVTKPVSKTKQVYVIKCRVLNALFCRCQMSKVNFISANFYV